MPAPYETNQFGIYLPGYNTWMSWEQYDALGIEPNALAPPATGGIVAGAGPEEPVSPNAARPFEQLGGTPAPAFAEPTAIPGTELLPDYMDIGPGAGPEPVVDYGYGADLLPSGVPDWTYQPGFAQTPDYAGLTGPSAYQPDAFSMPGEQAPPFTEPTPIPGTEGYAPSDYSYSGSMYGPDWWQTQGEPFVTADTGISDVGGDFGAGVEPWTYEPQMWETQQPTGIEGPAPYSPGVVYGAGDYATYPTLADTGLGPVVPYDIGPGTIGSGGDMGNLGNEAVTPYLYYGDYGQLAGVGPNEGIPAPQGIYDLVQPPELADLAGGADYSQMTDQELLNAAAQQGILPPDAPYPDTPPTSTLNLYPDLSTWGTPQGYGVTPTNYRNLLQYFPQDLGGWGEPMNWFGVRPQNPIGMFGVGGYTMPAGGGSYFGGRGSLVVPGGSSVGPLGGGSGGGPGGLGPFGWQHGRNVWFARHAMSPQAFNNMISNPQLQGGGRPFGGYSYNEYVSMWNQMHAPGGTLAGGVNYPGVEAGMGGAGTGPTGIATTNQ